MPLPPPLAAKRHSRQNIRDLADSSKGNANIIVDDVVYLAEPFFQDGVVAQAVDFVAGSDVVYFSSAGNRSDGAYETTSPSFVSTTVPGLGPGSYLDFDPGAGVDVLQGITLDSNLGTDADCNDPGDFCESFRPSLQWDDPFYTLGGVDTNLDVFLLNSTNSIVASSALNNIAIQQPFEVLARFTNLTGSTANYNLVIRKTAGPSPGRIKYVDFGGNEDTVDIEYDTSSPTINPHAAAAGAVAVAAVPYYNQSTAESFTSHGPSTLLFNPDGTTKSTPEVRQTPGLAAIDGVNTTFFGSDSITDDDTQPNFYGTSAAAPHAAAIAALVRQMNPSFTAAQVVTAMKNASTDIGASGFDNVSGWGLVNAYDAVVGAVVPATLPFNDSFESAGAIVGLGDEFQLVGTH